MKNYYHILRINNLAIQSDIKTAYRQLALDFHPDKNSDLNANQKFIEINEAYQVLSNHIRRKHYDELLLYQEKHKSLNERKRHRWEQEVNRASNRGQNKAEKYSNDFDYFSKKVLSQTIFIILFEFVLAIIFGEGTIFSWLFLTFTILISGFVVLFSNLEHTDLMLIGVGLIVLGFILFKKEVRRIHEE